MKVKGVVAIATAAVLLSATLTTARADQACIDAGQQLWSNYAAQNPTTRTEFWVSNDDAASLQCYYDSLVANGQTPPFEVHTGHFGLDPNAPQTSFIIVTHGVAPYPGGPT